MKDKIILHLCADVGSDTLPYKRAGYDVRLIGSDIGVENYHHDFGKVYGVIANPVCTQFSIAPGFQRTEAQAVAGMFLVNECIRIINESQPSAFWVIENPATGKLKNFIGKPTATYEPWEYGDPWTKRTALWGRFNMPEKKFTRWEDVPKNDKLYIRPGRSKPGIAFLHKSAIHNIPAFKGIEVKDDMSFRSLCPQGFANAFFKANR